jgi:hypothetical protein
MTIKVDGKPTTHPLAQLEQSPNPCPLFSSMHLQATEKNLPATKSNKSSISFFNPVQSSSRQSGDAYCCGRQAVEEDSGACFLLGDVD